MSIQSGAAVAFVAALGANLGKVCQKRGTKDLPELEMKAAIVKRYLSSPWWVVGLVLDVGGAIMTLLALAMAPVSVVQPILGCGLAFVAIFSHYLTADRLQLRDWGACALCVAGTVGIGLTTVEPSGLEAVSPARGALLVAAFGAAAAGCSAAAARGRLPTELAASVSAGLCFGLSACSTRCGLAAAAAAAAAAGPAARLAPLAGALGVALSIALSSTGFVQQTRGLRGGRALAVVAYANLVALGAAVLFGVAALGEPLPASRAGLAARAAALGCLAAGSAGLSRQGARAPRGHSV